MKKIIRLVTAVLLSLTVFSVTASAELVIDAADAAETAVSTVTAAGETLNPEESFSETIVSQEAAAEQTENGSEEVTEPEMPLLGGEIVTGKTEGTIPSEEVTNIPAETADGSSDGNRGVIFDGVLASFESTPSQAESETGTIPSDTSVAENEETSGSAEYVLSGKNIQLENGQYSYELVINPPDKLTFDNDLENTYQGVEGKYKLHYEIAEFGNHIMTATGLFKNIITASPLMKSIRDRVTEDTYFYQLDLRTNEGFSFINNLRYLVDGEKQGYSIYFDYDLSTNKQIFEIGDAMDDDEIAERWHQKTDLNKSKSIFYKYLPFLNTSQSF